MLILRSPIRETLRSPMQDMVEAPFDPNTPSTIANLLLWFDGDDASTIDAVNDNDPIGLQGDKSVNSLDATQTDPLIKPTYKIGERNGRSVVRYEAGDFLSVGNDPLLETNDFSIFVVMQRIAPLIDGTFIAVERQEVSPFLSGYFLYTVGDNLVLSAIRTGGQTSITSSGVSFPANEWSILTATKVSDVALLYKNGTQIASFPTGFASPVIYDTAPRSTPPPLADTRLGHGVNRFAFRGDLAEVAIYSRSVSDSERDTWWDYASAKWAISL